MRHTTYDEARIATVRPGRKGRVHTGTAIATRFVDSSVRTVLRPIALRGCTTELALPRVPRASARARVPALRWSLTESSALGSPHGLYDLSAMPRDPTASRAEAANGLTAADAKLIWARAAELQHVEVHETIGDRRSTQRSGPIAEEMALAEREALAHEVLSTHVATAALEAGLAAEFVALALAETQALTRAQRDAITRVPKDSAARVLRSNEEGIHASVLVVAPAEQILAALGRLLVEAPWLLDLERVEDPLTDGPSVARWRIPSVMDVAHAMESSGHLPALCYRAAVLGIAQLHTMVVPRPEHGPEVHEVLISMDLRAARAKRAAQLAGRPAVVGASAGAAAVSVTALMGGLVSVAGASALGGAAAAALVVALLVRPISAWRYRSAVAVLQSEVQSMAASVRDDLARSYGAEAEQIIRSAMPGTSLRARLKR